MTEAQQQLADKKLIDKEVKKFMKRLTNLNPSLKSVMVTDVNLKIEEKIKIFKDERTFAEKIMGI